MKETGKKAWNPGFLPTKTPLDRYECRHGMGYTVFDSAKDGLAARMTFFVPVGENCEIHDLVLTNETPEAKEVHLYGCMEWCLWNAVDDSTNYQRNLNIAECEAEDRILYHKTEYRERRDHYAYYAVNRDTAGWDTDRNTFLGPMGDWSAPALVERASSAFSRITGWYPIGCHHLKIALAPGESQRVIFLLGYGKNPRDRKFLSPGVIRKDDAHAAAAKYADPAAVDAAFAALGRYWDGLLSSYQLRSGKEKLDRMVNIWHQYQCMVTFNLSRSASYYETGTGRGMGFRDSCQDLYGFMHIVPQRARERILDIASIQFPDGSTYHQYQPLTKRGNNDIGGGFNDDPLWLVGAVCAYVKETGDFSILDHPTPFDNVPGSEAPLMEHIRRSIRFTRTHLGPHGLPLIGRADWNDCLNLNCFSAHPGESFQITGPSEGPVAESVFIGGMFVKYGTAYARLCLHLGLVDEAAKVTAAVDDMNRACLSAGWDGAWFRRAYDAYGAPIGSKECKEGQIFIEPQGMCVMAGIGKQSGEALKAMQSVEERLDTKYGIVLLQPAYTEYYLNLGEISSYPPGYKENAGIFCHNNPWVVCAEAEIGRGDRAFQVYARTCPAYTEAISEIHRTEPYVYSQMIAGKDAPSFGEAKNSWLTGTAAWTFLSISQAILGVQPTLDGLSVDPCIPSAWKEYTVHRKYRGADYDITVRNPNAVQKGVASVTVDGSPITGNVLPIAPKGAKVTVEVTMG